MHLKSSIIIGESNKIMNIFVPISSQELEVSSQELEVSSQELEVSSSELEVSSQELEVQRYKSLSFLYSMILDVR